MAIGEPSTQQIRTEEKVGAMDRTVSHLVGTANLGLRFVQTVVSLLAMLVAVFMGVQVFQLTKIYEQSVAITTVKEQLQTLNVNLGDAPKELAATSLQLGLNQKALAEAIAKMESGSDRIETVAARLESTETALGDLRADVTDIRASITGEKNPWFQGYNELMLKVDQIETDIKAIKAKLAN